MAGTLVSISIARHKGATPETLEEATLDADCGVRGDHHYRHSGAPADQQVTLVEAEQVAAFNRHTGLSVKPEQTRRNLLTRGVSLNELVGRRFRVGEAELEGMDLCQPCAGLGEALATPGVNKAQVVKAFVDRGGLRARIITGGTIRPGDPVTTGD